MTEKEKLIELIGRAPCCGFSSRKAVEHIADHLIANGVKIMPVSGWFECKFEPDSIFGTMTMNGETFDVYLGSIRTDAIGGGRNLMTLRMVKPIGYKRQITLIER